MRATRIVILLVLLAILLPSLTAQTNSREADIKAAVDAYLAKMPPPSAPVPMPTSKADTGSSS